MKISVNIKRISFWIIFSAAQHKPEVFRSSYAQEYSKKKRKKTPKTRVVLLKGAWAALLQLESSLLLLQPHGDCCSWILQQSPPYKKWDKVRVTCLEPCFVEHQKNSKPSQWLCRLKKVHPKIIKHKWLMHTDKKRQLVFWTRRIGIRICRLCLSAAI